MIKLEPYISLDIETTGLDITKAQVLEIGLVYDDGVTPINDLVKASFICKPSTDYYEPYAMAMNAAILYDIHQNLHTGSKRCIMNFWESIGAPKSVTFAGKNVGMFDLPILKNNKFLLPHHKHRVIDVGSIYFSKFGYCPSLNEINGLIGLPLVTHRAQEDALNVVQAIRYIHEERKND